MISVGSVVQASVQGRIYVGRAFYEKVCAARAGAAE